MTLLGFAVVSIGAEIPDAVNAIVVARRGYGAMACSSCMGSQAPRRAHSLLGALMESGGALDGLHPLWNK